MKLFKNATLLAAFLALLLIAAPAVAQEAEEVEEEEDALPAFVEPKLKGDAFFVETFSGDWESRWAHAIGDKYNGKATVQFTQGTQDNGLYIDTAARHYGVAAAFPKPADPSQGMVFQYEARLEDGLDCGGAYLKFLTAEEGFKPAEVNGDSPYTVMFGPDKCGNTNKVHVIIRHKNPLDGTIEEKHLAAPPSIVDDKKPHLYTLVVKPDNTYEVLVDSESKKSGSLFTDFEPPFNPPAEIDDAEDSKPADWVDEAKIADPEAKKPEDWDEDAPSEVVDDEAEKPAGWLDAEPDEVVDPEAKQPDDWDEEEDGEWEAPIIKNPKCELAPGCGPWSPPMKPNPAYKGKWYPPLVDNPAYKGPWAPRKIPNPKFYEDKTPLAAIGKVGAVALEIWTMSKGLVVDNILVAQDDAVADDFAEASWRVKYDAISAAEEKESAKNIKTPKGPPYMVGTLYAALESDALKPYEKELKPVVEYFEKNPLVLYALVIAAPLLLLAMTLMVCSGGSSSAEKEEDETSAASKKDDDKATKDDEPAEEAEEEEDEEEEEEKKEEETTTRRRTRRAQ